MKKRPCSHCGKTMKSAKESPTCHPCRAVERLRPCPQCGKEHRVWKKSHAVSYCSPDCAALARRADMTRVCEICGVEFKRKRGGNNAGRCCSRVCGFELQRRQRRQRRERARPVVVDAWEWRSLVFYRPCIDCGQPITNRAKGQPKSVCDIRCAGRVRTRRLGGVPLGEMVTSECGTCNETYTYVRRGGNRTDCDDCRTVKRRKAEAKARRAARAKARREGRYKGNDHRKRARRYNVDYEPIQPLYIYERDNWTCHLCGKKTKKFYSRTGYDPMGPTLDHIIPMSKGGPHIKSNVALAHHICNTRKSDGAVGEQLLLVG